jgi:hypothetical protein
MCCYRCRYTCRYTCRCTRRYSTPYSVDTTGVAARAGGHCYMYEIKLSNKDELKFGDHENLWFLYRGGRSSSDALREKEDKRRVGEPKDLRPPGLGWLEQPARHLLMFHIQRTRYVSVHCRILVQSRQR